MVPDGGDSRQSRTVEIDRDLTQGACGERSEPEHRDARERDRRMDAAMSTALVIVGAGEGTRLKATVRKALVDVGGQTLVERSALAFRDVPGIVDRVVVLHPEDAA